MNVLVYSGAGVLPVSLTNVLTSLRSILSPYYTVQSINYSVFTSQPWRSSCALIVLPQFHSLSLDANKQLAEYVQAGGKCLTFGANPRIKSRSLDLAIRFMPIGLEDVSVDLPLTFYDKGNHCHVAFERENFVQRKDSPHITTLISSDGVQFSCFQETENANLVGFDALNNVSILARYDSKENEAGRPACLSMKISDGRLTLLCPSIEDPLTQDPARSLLSSFSSNIMSFEHSRTKFLKNVLQDLGLNIPDDPPSYLSSHPLPLLLTSTRHCSAPLSRSIRAIFNLGQDLEGLHKDANDDFQFRSFDSQHALEFLASSRKAAGADTNASEGRLKHILVCKDGILPDRQITPLFDLGAYYETIRRSRESIALTDGEDGSWGIGEVVLYGEVVTSTQTMFDKNPSFLSCLPVPLLSLASHQLAGRGRGSNLWLSPLGCLQASLLLRVQLSSTPTVPSFPVGKLVFIQYLFALAVVEACRDNQVLGERLGSKVRLKWPNDLYADFGVEGKEEFKKVGGVLVNTNFEGPKIDIVVGCGLNILNEPPIPSLTLLRELNSAGQTCGDLNLERTAAIIMARFESMWNLFLQERSFEPFMRLYLDRWLHSNQRVVLTSTKPHTAVRIVGITPDHGLLRTLPERRDPWTTRNESYIDLQPDGNSFDLMAGLIKTKTM